MTMNYVPVEPRKRLHVGDRVSFFATSDNARGYAVIVRFDDCDEADLVANFSVHIRCADENEDRFISKFNGDQLCVLTPESKREAAEQHAAAGIGPEAKPGAKDDTGKSRIDLIPTSLFRAVLRHFGTSHYPGRAMLEIGRVLDYGARLAPRPDGTKGYGEDNWQGVANGKVRYVAAAMRHLSKHAIGELTDPDSGLYHLAHAATCLMFACWLERLGAATFAGVITYPQESGASVTEVLEELINYRELAATDSLARAFAAVISGLEQGLAA